MLHWIGVKTGLSSQNIYDIYYSEIKDQRARLDAVKAVISKKALEASDAKKAFFDKEKARKPMAKTSDARSVAFAGVAGLSTDPKPVEAPSEAVKAEVKSEAAVNAPKAPTSHAAMKAKEHISGKMEKAETFSDVFKIEFARNRKPTLDLEVLLDSPIPQTDRQVKIAAGMIKRISEMMDKVDVMYPDGNIEKDWKAYSDTMGVYLRVLMKTKEMVEKNDRAEKELASKPAAAPAPALAAPGK